VEVMILVHQVAVMTSYSLALLQMRWKHLLIIVFCSLK
jgi:hypothetical protein